MKRIQHICTLLEQAYGRPECKPVRKTLDELIFTILSQNTTRANYEKAYGNLRRQFRTWEDVSRANTQEIAREIRVGGLADIKAERIKNVLNGIRSLRGKLDLDFLAEMPDHEALEFLLQFEGVGSKTASCVLMFSLCRPVFPVDTHVHRVSQRLGLINASVNAEAAHEILGKMIPDEMVYSLHVNLVTHGRRICKARNPSCEICVLLKTCPYGQSLIKR